MVVNDVRQMVCRQLVGTFVEHLIVKNIALYHHVTADNVVNMHLDARVYLEANNILLSVVNHLFHLLSRERQRVAHHHSCACVILEVLYLAAFLLQLLWSVEGDVCFASFEQLVNILLVDASALALAVGTFVAAVAYALVKLNAEPFERLNDVCLSTLNETVGVGVFYAEHHVAAVLLGE